MTTESLRPVLEVVRVVFPRRSFVCACLATFIALAMTATPATADLIFDPVKDWSGVSNTSSSIWQYGTSLTVGGPMTLFSLHGAEATPPTYDWWSFTGPVLAFNSSGGTIVGLGGIPNSIVWPADQLLIAPGGKNGTPQNTVLRWVAPITETYDITGRFSDLQRASVSMNVLLDGVPLFTSVFTGGFAHQGNRPFSFPDLALTAGQRLDFVVSSGGNDGEDVLGIDAKIVSLSAQVVPEPSSLMLCGIGAAIFASSAAWRRRTMATLSRLTCLG